MTATTYKRLPASLKNSTKIFRGVPQERINDACNQLR